MSTATSPASADLADTHHRIANVRLSLDALLVFRWLAACSALVLGLGFFRQLVVAAVGADTDTFGWNLISLDQEGNLPTWFSTLLLFAGGVAAFVVARVARRTEPRNALGWSLLAAIFVLLSADEFMQLHEMTKGPLRAWRDWTGVLAFPWVAWAIPLVLVLGAAFVPFLLRLRRTTANRLVVAGAVYVFGALVMEMVAGPVIEWHGRGDFYAVCFMIEETGEQLGALLFIRAVLLHLTESTRTVSLDLRQRA